MDGFRLSPPRSEYTSNLSSDTPRRDIQVPGKNTPLTHPFFALQMTASFSHRKTHSGCPGCDQILGREVERRETGAQQCAVAKRMEHEAPANDVGPRQPLAEQAVRHQHVRTEGGEVSACCFGHSFPSHYQTTAHFAQFTTVLEYSG